MDTPRPTDPNAELQPPSDAALLKSAETLEQSSAFLEGVRSFCAEDYPGARRKFHSLLLAGAKSPHLFAACAHCFLLEGDQRRADELYARAEELTPDLPDVLYSRAVLFVQAGEWDEATARLIRLSENPPLIRQGAFYLGILFPSVEELLCDVRLRLGQLHLDQGKNDLARHWYQRAIEAKPDNITALQRLGELAILSKNYLDAINHLNRILEISPLEEDRINAHNNLGIACYENGALEEAIGHLTWVLHHAPSNPTAIYNLNFIYEREGIFLRPPEIQRGIRFVDVAEGAQPIFELSNTGEMVGGEELAVIGRSTDMLRVMRLARIAAARSAPVLLRGETGTGKELLAHMITLNSSRRDAPFSVINCASMPELLLESELFGYEKGAFTGARASKQGRLEIARGGTIFLDEVTALSPMLQGKLYRSLQDGRYTPLGATRVLTVEVRIIAATNRDLRALITEGSFREDLFYLLNVISIDLPPLRDRREDVPLLVEFFLRKYSRQSSNRARARISAEDLQTLMEYEWPGNVRELENLIERAVVMGSKSSLYLEELVRLRRRRSTALRENPQATEKVTYPPRDQPRGARKTPHPLRPPGLREQPEARRPRPRHQPLHTLAQTQAIRA